jgi:hypothetical protein
MRKKSLGSCVTASRLIHPRTLLFFFICPSFRSLKGIITCGLDQQKTPKQPDGRGGSRRVQKGYLFPSRAREKSRTIHAAIHKKKGKIHAATPGRC